MNTNLMNVSALFVRIRVYSWLIVERAYYEFHGKTAKWRVGGVEGY